MGAPTGQPQSSGKGNVTTPATSAQPSMGQPNQYPNTIGGWDNASIQPQSSGNTTNGKSGGKGQSSWQPFQTNWVPPDTSNLYNTNVSSNAFVNPNMLNWEVAGGNDGGNDGDSGGVSV